MNDTDLSSPFQQFAEQHDLTYIERGSIGFSYAVTGQRTISDYVGGALPGGLFGVIARSEEKVLASRKAGFIDGPTLGTAGHHDVRQKQGGSEVEYVRDSVMLWTRVPEAASYLPSVSCRDAEFQGLADRMVGPGGLIPFITQFELESIEFNRRYRIGIIRGSSENRLRRLFSPTFIDWMASTAPERTLFEFSGGFLAVTVGGQMSGPGELEQVCEVSAHIAERLRSEALEDTPTSELRPGPTAEERKATAELDEQIAEANFDAPPTEVSAAIKKLKPIAARAGRQSRRSGGLARRLFLGLFHGSMDRGLARKLALEAVLAAYAERHGLQRGSASEFRARALALMLPAVSGTVLSGSLPGTAVQCELAVARGLYRERHDGVGVAALLEPGPEWRDTSIRVMPANPREAIYTGGYPVFEPQGLQRLSSSDREQAERAHALGGGRLRPHYEPSIGATGSAAPAFPEAATSWLLDPQRLGHSALVLEGSTLALASEAGRLEEWSAQDLDDFCASAAPVVHAFGAG